MPIQANLQAPDFSLLDETGVTRSLSDYHGKVVVLYFYPKDDTPGCTVEACAFRDDFSAYSDLGVEILGVSPDLPKSHAKFKEKYLLPFTLLSDPDHSVADIYGVWGLKKFAGKSYHGIFRTTFVISPDGKIKKVFEGVKPTGHSLEVIEALK